MNVRCWRVSAEEKIRYGHVLLYYGSNYEPGPFSQELYKLDSNNMTGNATKPNLSRNETKRHAAKFSTADCETFDSLKRLVQRYSKMTHLNH
jgi:hypothetical protein